MKNLSKKTFLEELMSRNYKPLDIILPKITIGIAGCGGLGSNIAHMLARTGIEKFIIADFDTVTISNLNRQFFFKKDIGKPKVDALEDNLRKINPYLTIIKHNTKITPDNFFSIFNKTFIIIEAFDKVSEKTMLLNTFLDNNSKDHFFNISFRYGRNRII